MLPIRHYIFSNLGLCKICQEMMKERGNQKKPDDCSASHFVAFNFSHVNFMMGHSSKLIVSPLNHVACFPQSTQVK